MRFGEPDESGEKRAWKAAANNGEAQARRVEKLRRVGLLVLAAIVLLPPYLLGLLAAGGSVLYVCIAAVRRMTRSAA